MEFEKQRRNCCKKCKHLYYNGKGFSCAETRQELDFKDEMPQCPKDYWVDFIVAKKDRYERLQSN